MIGDVIGNFRLVERLGRGGMGEVYRAEHRDLQTPVAVKLLNDDISEDHDHVQRFFNEARIVSKIKHAGTVKIFDSGFHKGQAYLIMELLEGESLARRLDRGPLPPPQVLDVARQIASVLDATHRQGVIHRDLKPDNIYLVFDDERASGERVKILDFGIAKLSGTLSSASPKTSGTMGTPAYMAPEQWSDSSQVDWRADAYSLGCVMFEMACGRPPFVAATIPEAYTKHAHTQPPSPRSLNTDVSPDLDALILRLLAKDPADRCVSMGQVTRELEAIANGTDPATVARDSRPIRAQTSPTPTPKLSAAPPPTMTTLGASAAEMQATRARRPALVGGAIAGIAVLGIVVFVMTRGGAKDAAQEPAPAREVAPAAAPQPQPQPALQPQPAPQPQPQPQSQPQPPPQPSPPQPSPQPAPQPQPHASQGPASPQPHAHAAVPHTTPKPPLVVPHTIDAGVAQPPPGDDLGGRL